MKTNINEGFELNFNHNYKEIEGYYDFLFSDLKENETIRMVTQINKENSNPIIFTANDHLRSKNDLINYIKRLDSSYGLGNVGYSISSAVFDYDSNRVDENGKVVKPSSSTFKYINKIVIDIDFYIGVSKDRFVLGRIKDDYINFAALVVYNRLMEIFKDNSIDVLRPSYTAMSGSGLQIAFNFDRQLDREQATTLFNFLKFKINKADLTIFLGDSLENLTKVTAKIDATSLDITHTQRCIGTLHQKHKTLSKRLYVFENFDTSTKSIIDTFENICNKLTPKKHEEFMNYITKSIEKTRSILNESIIQFETDKYLQISKLEQYSKKALIKPNEIQSIETELLYKIKSSDIKIIDLIREHVTIDHESLSFIALKCPFHEDQKYSFAIYVNETIDILYDFHDGVSYTLISFWAKLFDVSKSIAISQIAQKAGIKLNKSERKDFEKLEIEEIINVLLDKINTKDFVYYRLANKNRNCIIRYKDTGESFQFDGVHLLAKHVLNNQLNIKDADDKLVIEFVKKFQERILIDAFEEFAPGKETVFERNFIKLINLWVPSLNYKKAHEHKEELIEEFNGKIKIDKTITLLKERTPWTFKYLLQLTQKGDLKWFINWLSETANYKTMPTIPVIFGTPGVGKNLFISTIIEWYHNNEYTKVLNSDRVMSNFNSVLEDASFVVLDEGDISSGKDFDSLKFLSGNDKIAIEKKGVDVKMKSRYFNIILFSNGDVPVRHRYNDRRIQYFSTEKTLLDTCKKLDVNIETFIKNIKEEMVQFWGIILNLDVNKKLSISNTKDKIFIQQILKQHNFGELILKLLNNEWQDIALQLNENVQDPTVMKSNLELLEEIKSQFKNESKISLTLINKYLGAMNFKYKTSVQQFIKQNDLKDLGIDIQVNDNDVKIIINKKKLKNLINVPNILDLYIKNRKKKNDEILDIINIAIKKNNPDFDFLNNIKDIDKAINDIEVTNTENNKDPIEKKIAKINPVLDNAPKIPGIP